jgi:threonine dehydratase
MPSVAWQDVQRARQRIAPFAHRTPVLTSTSIDCATGAKVFLKCENLQRTGSFKFRGACNAVAFLSEAEKRCGVLTHSSGNHAQALALAAQLHQVKAHVVMPENAPEVKRRATRDFGAIVVECPSTHRGRVDTAARVQEETGAIFISAHDDPRVIAGQGTAVCELIEEIERPDLILAPVGGGGLLSGTLIAAKHMLPHVVVIGCEPAGADDAARSIERGERITDFVPQTIADGLRTPHGENTFDIIRDLVDGIVLVSEEAILDAMRFVWERMKIVIEPSSAVAVAPLLSASPDIEGKRVGVILSGGNVDLADYFGHLAQGQ